MGGGYLGDSQRMVQQVGPYLGLSRWHHRYGAVCGDLPSNASARRSIGKFLLHNNEHSRMGSLGKTGSAYRRNAAGVIFLALITAKTIRFFRHLLPLDISRVEFSKAVFF